MSVCVLEQHAQSEANMEIANARHVDIFGVKCEGSNTILWVRDSDDVNLYGFGGAADAFPNTSFYPADFRPYTPTMIRVERTPTFKLANVWVGIHKDTVLKRMCLIYFLMQTNTKKNGLILLKTFFWRTPTQVNVLDAPRGGVNSHTAPILPTPTPRGALEVLQWPAGDIEKIIQSQWTPWPGYRVDPTMWSVVVESDGPSVDRAKAVATDRPVVYQRGHPLRSIPLSLESRSRFNPGTSARSSFYRFDCKSNKDLSAFY